MTETEGSVGTRDRSPAFPTIPLGTALERLAQFESHFKRSAARPDKVGVAWGIKAQGYAARVTAALRYFGLLEYQSAGGARSVVVSELGRNYLRAQQDETKRQIIAAVALKPKQIATFWNLWGPDRPANAACLDELVLKHGFSEAGAKDFLKVYDATIAFAKPASDVKVMQHEVVGGDDETTVDEPPAGDSGTGTRQETQIRRVKMVSGERELTTGLLSKGTSFRLIVDGPVGVKEIERLIAKLELDKEILAETDDDKPVEE